MIERMWPVLAVIERCAVDLPELEALYYQRGRRGHLAQLTKYLEQRAASGHLCTMPDTTVAARIVTEAIVWFAWHRREDRDATLYDDDRGTAHGHRVRVPRAHRIDLMTTTASRMREEPLLAPAGTELPKMYFRPVLAIAAGLVVLELAVAARYGFHRDELYFLACARHLAWGYVDQPPLVPAMAKLATALVGPSVVGIRVLPALAGGAAVVFTALMARELGGGRKAQVLAALAAATSPQMLAAFHLLSTIAFDLFFWSAILLLVVRLLRTGDERLWLAVGAVAGVGLMNKFNVAFLLLGLAAGLLWGGRGRMLRSRWLWVGCRRWPSSYGPPTSSGTLSTLGRLRHVAQPPPRELHPGCLPRLHSRPVHCDGAGACRPVVRRTAAPVASPLRQAARTGLPRPPGAVRRRRGPSPITWPACTSSSSPPAESGPKAAWTPGIRRGVSEDGWP